ncbi:MAG: BamA/TamA family outer membrane protein [Endozoicomonas sp. (ex Botrylloides leachii)]|nr:BamA/TamA family outer membrane protein [Endozoicomonas sp. (ex Botrylloides leachii)]
MSKIYANETEDSEKQFVGVPFIFSSQDWSTAIGGSGLLRHAGQPQAVLFGTAIVSKNKSWLGYLNLDNLIMPNMKQWLISISAIEANFSETNYYVPGNPKFIDEQAGSNDSNPDDYVRTSGRESRYKVKFKYILPIGNGRQGALASMAQQDKNSFQKSRIWNPLQSGQTSLEFQPFYERQVLGDKAKTNDSNQAMGMRFIVDYDNRNSTQLPTRGSELSFTLSHDWGSSSRPKWTTWEGAYSKFLNIGANNFMRQQVIAFNAWLADTPTWNDTTTINGTQQYQRPPSFAANSLGGWNRLRGYENNRFYDRSAVSYSLEYRVMPQWQPLNNLPVIGAYNIPWWQWTLFIDAGRVADTFSLSQLHSHMKYSIGGGIRFDVEGVTVRTEIASSKEDTEFRVFVNQPF